MMIPATPFIHVNGERADNPDRTNASLLSTELVVNVCHDEALRGRRKEARTDRKEKAGGGKRKEKKRAVQEQKRNQSSYKLCYK